MALTPRYYNSMTDYIIPEDLPIVPEPSMTFALELDGQRCRGTKDGIDALIQTIYMILRTEKGLFLIYPSWYGLKTNDLYGRPHEYVFAELCARIKEALTTDDRIEDVTDFRLVAEKSTGTDLYIAYTVQSHLGEIGAEGVYRFV